MPKQPLEALGVMVREKRGKKKLRETAREIGIGPATLMRVENGRIPDVETFGKICVWMNVDPGTFLGYTPTTASSPSISAHFRADQNPTQETVNALATMVLYTLKAQPRFPGPES